MIPAGGEGKGAGPLHQPARHGTEKIGKGTQCNGNSTGAKRRMWGGHANNIEQQRNGKDRAAATDEAENESDQAPGQNGEDIWPHAIHARLCNPPAPIP